MTETLPFEYGFLYRTVSNPNFTPEELSKIADGVQMDIDGQTYFQSNGYGMNGYIFNYGIDHDRYFHPIGFIESKQIVVVEVMVKEREVTQGHLQMSGMSFSTSDIVKEYKKICRAHIDVNTFIMYWEKVL